MLPKYTYLYGFCKEEAASLALQPYVEVLEYKIRAAKALSERLLKPHFMERDVHRINHIQKAIKFNTELLSELD